MYNTKSMLLSMMTPDWIAYTDEWVARCLQQPNSIHVFLCDLRSHYHNIDYFRSLLDSHEQQRANQFITSQHNTHLIQARERFIITRGLLKRLLMTLLNKPHDHIHFSYGTRGKPQLEFTHQNNNVRPTCLFNVSHSRNHALIALSLMHEVGGDIEYQKKLPNYAQLAARVLHPFEGQWFNCLPLEEQHHAFYQIWTRKEALSKVDGAGLSQRFSELYLPKMTSITTPIRVHLNNNQDNILWLYDLPNFQEEYALALAWRGHTEHVYSYQL